jgi:uncharacterized phage protein (TIGR01671 family)
MSRVIKFRAWDGKKMHLPEHSDTDDFFITAEGEVRYIHEVGVVGHKSDSHRNGWLLMQFTGLKDGKGNDIYEGDLITLRGKYLYEVKFEDGKFICDHVIKEYGRWGDLKRMSDMDFDRYGHEVIGNIYENKELVTDK